MKLLSENNFNKNKSFGQKNNKNKSEAGTNHLQIRTKLVVLPKM
jgi:hypothetical protein